MSSDSQDRRVRWQDRARSFLRMILIVFMVNGTFYLAYAFVPHPYSYGVYILLCVCAATFVRRQVEA